MMAAEWVFVALGSNMGGREQNLAFARERLSQLPETTLRAESEIEETVPLGPVPQGPYLNQMVLLETELGPAELLSRLLAIETAAGRVRRERWGPRVLDLDIVRFGNRDVRQANLVIPHPELPNRPFWARELAQLEPHAR